jgi:hypothetical protein
LDCSIQTVPFDSPRKAAMTLRLHSLVLVVTALGFGSALAQSAATVKVFKSPYCGCCGEWVEHLRQNGFQVQTHDVSNIPATRKQLGMPDQLGSCHTATIDAYVVEGHVPAADIRRLLKDKPKALGLAVPSMPPGSPGMESARPVPYQTLLVQTDGTSKVFAQH